MKNKYFTIGKLTFSLSFPEEVTPPPHFMLFESGEEGCGYKYEMRLTEELPVPEGELIAQREDLKVFRKGEYEMRLLVARGRDGFYGCYMETAEDAATVFFHRSFIDLLSLDTVFSSLFALERRAMAFEGIVLHCACLMHEGSAILFSAPSGVGKSTQASLWEKYRGARTKNGDRALLVKEEDAWYAMGWPVCGSSEICSNSMLPIRAVVTLEQAKTNYAARITAMQAFTSLYGEVTVNSWNRAAQVLAMDLLEDLISRIPVIHLACNISEEAVETLERMVVSSEL